MPFSSNSGLPPKRLISSGTLRRVSVHSGQGGVSSEHAGAAGDVLRSVENAVSYVPYCNVSGLSRRSKIVVVANTQVKNHGMTSGDIILDRHERLGKIT